MQLLKHYLSLYLSQTLYVFSLVSAYFSGLVGTKLEYLQLIHKFFFNEFFYSLNKLKECYFSFLERIFHVKYFLIQDSLSVASLLLILTKIFFGKFGLILHFSLFILFFLTALFLFLSEKLKNILYKIIFKGLGPYYTMENAYSPYDDPWDDLLFDFYYYGPMEEEDKKHYIAPEIKFYNYFFFSFLYFLLFIRLCFFAEPFLFIFLKFIFSYMLIFNKLNFFSYIISIFVILSKFVFFLHLDNFKQFRSVWEYRHDEFFYSNLMLAPTIENAKFIACCIISMIYSTNKKYFYDYNYRRKEPKEEKKSWYKKEFKQKNSLHKENKLFSFYANMDSVLDNINHPRTYALSRNRTYFSLYKSNQMGQKVIKFIVSLLLFIVFSNYSLNYLFIFFENDPDFLFNEPFFMLTEKGINIFKNLYGNLFHKEYFKHRIYIKVKNDDGKKIMHFYNETTLKCDRSKPLYFYSQIDACNVSSIVTVGNSVQIDDSFYDDLMNNYVEKESTLVTTHLNAFNDNFFINKDLNFISELKNNHDQLYTYMGKLLNCPVGPPVHLYGGFKQFSLCDFDTCDSKKERNEVNKILVQKLLNCSKESAKLKSFMQEIQNIYEKNANHQEKLYSVWENKSIEKVKSDIARIKEIGDTFGAAKYKFFKDAAPACNFELDDGVKNKSIILSKTHKSLSNDLIRDNWSFNTKKRNAKHKFNSINKVDDTD